MLKIGWASLVHPDDVERTDAEVEEQLKGKSVANFVNRYRHKDGSYVTLEWQATFAEEGIVHAHARDITERTKMEDELGKRHEETMAILEGSRDAIVVNDQEHFIYLNQKAVELLGYQSPSELIGRPFIDHFAPEHRALIRKRAKERSEGESPPAQYEVLVQSKDGTSIPVEFNVSVIEFDGKPAILNAIRDISERKHAEEEIQSLARFPSENTNPVLRISEDGVILYANNASDSLLKEWDTAEGGNVPQSWLDHVSDVFTDGVGKVVEEVHEDRIFSFNIAPIPEGGYANVYGRDITGRIRMEQDLRQSEEQYRLLVEGTRDYAIFMLARALGGSSSIPGPPIVLFFQNQKMAKETFRANLIAFLLSLYLVTIPMYVMNGLITWELTRTSIIFILPILLGAWSGIKLSHRVDETSFKRIVLVLVVLAGFMSILTGSGIL